MKEIEGRDISHSYVSPGSSVLSLNGVSIEVASGELIVILGHNGSGKSTLVKHLNALLPLQKGELAVAGMDVKDPSLLWELRRKCGMVFQNPDNQFVSSIVYEDIAFGLENYDTPAEQIPRKVDGVLELVGMPGAGKRSTHMLSGGQKQRIALAGVLAVDADIIVFDEATIMLDPVGKQEVMEMIRRLHVQEHKTIIMISHDMEDAVIADRVCIMAEGQILSVGAPREILTDRPLLVSAGLTPPLSVQLYYDLQENGIELHRCPLTIEELVEELCRLN
jgi:energy-coupling factor transport system ATP-binding protein